ncbi:hypothetical protein SAMN06272755_2630 [Picosynechococcus sp. OG1]|nr:hypothetical protein SAMN06272755_2630 [Picosynechococcus sp. OG1]SMQ82615.1 hypothetical protein SAMN06272774_1906 [Synechococcus sp. 7002]
MKNLNNWFFLETFSIFNYFSLSIEHTQQKKEDLMNFLYFFGVKKQLGQHRNLLLCCGKSRADHVNVILNLAGQRCRSCCI